MQAGEKCAAEIDGDTERGGEKRALAAEHAMVDGAGDETDPGIFAQRGDMAEFERSGRGCHGKSSRETPHKAVFRLDDAADWLRHLWLRCRCARKTGLRKLSTHSENHL